MKQMIAVKYLLVTSMLLIASSAHAVGFKGVVGFGVDLGGATIATGVYSDGTKVDAKANEGLLINGGVVMITDKFETQLTVGYKSGGPKAQNGSITFDTVPVELMEFIRASNMRIGLGFVSQNSPKLVIDIPGTSTTTKYDNAIGSVAQIGWAPANSPFSIDLHYTAINYKPSNVVNAKSIYGNTFGLYMSFFF